MSRKQKQQGNVLIVAIFTLVVMGFLATSLNRVRWASNDALTQEFLGSQAWLLANSANEWALTQIYPVGSSAVSDACSVVNVVPSIDLANDNCALEVVQCTSIGELNLDGEDRRFFKIEATAACGNDNIKVTRRQEVWVRE
ncbi:MSHA biogenesis protein MshP [Vibrio splendidus]